MTADQLTELVTTGGAYGVMIVVAYALFRGYLVLGRELQAVRDRVEELKTDLHTATTKSEQMMAEHQKQAQQSQQDMQRTIAAQLQMLERAYGTPATREGG